MNNSFEILKKIITILELDDDNSITLYELDTNKEEQKKTETKKVSPKKIAAKSTKAKTVKKKAEKVSKK